MFYDDPGKVPVEDLFARACFPVDSPGHVAAPLGSDVLPGGTVVYAFVSGPYPEVPRAYPGLYRYLSELGWQEDGPVRDDPDGMMERAARWSAPRARSSAARSTPSPAATRGDTSSGR